MKSNSYFILNGATTETTGDFPVVGMDKFSVNIRGKSFDSSPATGIANLLVKLNENDTFTNIFSYVFNGNSGTFVQFDGPIHTLRASISPYTTGTYDAVCMYSYHE